MENGDHTICIDYNQQISKFPRTTKPMGFLRSFFHNFIQITPLKNGDHTICIHYKQISQLARIHWCNWFYEVLFQLFHTNHLLRKREQHNLHWLQTDFDIRTNPLRQRVLWGPLSIISYKSPTWKTGTTQFAWITSKSFRNFQETTETMGFMRYSFHYFTQITPLENGDHTLCIEYNQEFSKFARNHWANGFYGVPLHLFHTNHPLGKREPHNLHWLQTELEISTNPLRQRVL